MNLAAIIGARPQFIKAKPVTDELKQFNAIKSIVIHTGQHYDYEMSKLFFDELDIPAPDYHLKVGSGEHGLQTGKMLIRIEKVLQKEKPDLVLVFGDTNSTLAGALAAAKLHIPVAHIEAGMRSFNKDMPEEINRILTNHIADYLFCSTETAVNNLKNEGFKNIINNGKLIKASFHQSPIITHQLPIVVNVGDVMYDIWLSSIKIAKEESRILQTLGLKPKSYYLVTIHRPRNTDNYNTLKDILEALNELDFPVVFPIHPRTKERMKRYSNITVEQFDNILSIEPAGYLDMLVLEKNARKILTDSGGVQKEAYFSQVPCITLREETEWVETVKSGWNVLVGSDKKKIIEATNYSIPTKDTNTFFGDGKSSKRICRYIIDYVRQKALD